MVVALFERTRRAPVRIVRFYKSAGADRLTVEIRNDTPGRVRLYSIQLHSQVATNWPSVTEIHLGYTNCTEKFLRIDVDPPASVWPRPWKASLVYMPAFSRPKLLTWQLREAWKTKSLRQGFNLRAGWEGTQRTFSEEIPQ